MIVGANGSRAATIEKLGKRLEMPSNHDQSGGRSLGRLVSSGESQDSHANLLSKVLVIFGILVYVAAQGAFLAGPMWNRDLPPEPDDSLAYLTKTAQMDECFFQDCEALKDLRRQMASAQTDPAVRQQRTQIVGRVFQVYHPLFSMMILGVAKAFSTDTITAYKLLWNVSPVFFGLGLAYWLGILWGPAAAGLALFMLAFSIFPDTGLHYLVPANCALGLALFVWARILHRKGDAPFMLVLGALALVLIHPVGRIYAVMAAVLAATVFGIPEKPRTRAGIVGCLVIVALAFVASATVDRPMLGFRPEPYGSGQGYFSALLESIIEVGMQGQRTEPALLRAPLMFFGAVVCGFLSVAAVRRTVLRRVFIILSVFLLASLFYVLPRHPADLFMRMLIPMVALFFGGVGALTWFTLCRSWIVLRRERLPPGDGPALSLALHWPLVAFTVLAWFMLKVMLTGLEGWIVLADYMRDREPVKLSQSQPELLLSQSRLEEKVLYDSMIIMPFYFLNGAMSRGAVFYPAIRGTADEQAWLNSLDLRYAALYNPTVTTQWTDGFDEEDWWQSMPSLRYSVLDRQKPNRTLSINGRIPMSRLLWVQVEPQDGGPVRSLEVLVEDVTADTLVEVVPLDSSGTLLQSETVTATVRVGRTGWVRMALPDRTTLRGIRILSPEGKGSYAIGGLRFGDDRLRWPWNSKASMTSRLRAGDTTPVTVSFDPKKLLPPPLRSRRLSVLDDSGSAVLIRMDPP